MTALRVAVIGGGWAGLAAAVAATQAGHRVTVFEAARQWGGRARALPCTLPDGSRLQLDNGQHILIGAYRDTLSLMRTLGVDPDAALLRGSVRVRQDETLLGELGLRVDAANIIERRRPTREVRLGVSRIEIIKV